MRVGPGEVERGRAARAERERRDVHDEPLRVAAGEHAPEQRAAAFDEHLQHAFAPEQRERLVEIDAVAVGRGRDDLDLGAGRAPRVDRAPARRVGRDDQRGRELGVEQRTGRRDATARVEQHAQRRVIGQRASTSRTVSAGWSASAVPAPTTIACESARSSCASARARLGGEPARRAVGGGDPTVDARRDLGDDERPAGAAVMRDTARDRAPRARRRRRRSRRRPRRAAARTRRRRRADRDLRARRRRGSTPAAISASAHGGVRPWCEHGSSVTYAVAPRARSPACAQRAGFGVRVAGRLGRARGRRPRRRGRARSRPRDWARCGGERRRRPPAPGPSPRRRARSLTRVRPAGRGNDDRPGRRARESGATAENGVDALSHPDSDRRPRNHTWSAPGWRPGVRGLGLGPRASSSPPVGTFTQPRGLSCRCLLPARLPARPENCNVF